MSWSTVARFEEKLSTGASLTCRFERYSDRYYTDHQFFMHYTPSSADGVPQKIFQWGCDNIEYKNETRKDLANVAKFVATILERFDEEHIVSYLENSDGRTCGFRSVKGLAENFRLILDDPELDDETKLTCLLYTGNSSFFLGTDASQNGIKSDLVVAKKLTKINQKRPSTVHDLRMTLNPFFAQYGDDEYDFIRFVKSTSFTWNRGFSNVEYREMIKRICAIIQTDVIGDSLVKDVDLMPVDQLTMDANSFGTYLNKLPISTKKYRDYLMGLSVDNFWKLLKTKVDTLKRLPADLAIKESNRILGPVVASVNCIDVANDVHAAAVYKLREVMRENVSAYSWKSFYETIMDNHERVNSGVLIASYLRNPEVTFDGFKDLRKIVEIFITRQGVMQWIRKADVSEQVIEMMLPLLGAYDLAQLIVHVAENTTNGFTLTQWKNIFEKYDTLKDTPIAWWVDML